jgi:hypothetical protein
MFEYYTIKSAPPLKQLAMFPRTARERTSTRIEDDQQNEVTITVRDLDSNFTHWGI